MSRAVRGKESTDAHTIMTIPSIITSLSDVIWRPLATFEHGHVILKDITPEPDINTDTVSALAAGKENDYNRKGPRCCNIS